MEDKFERVEIGQYTGSKAVRSLDYIVFNEIKDFPPRFFDHEPAEVNICIAGEAKASVGDDTINLKPGDFFFVNPYVKHAIYTKTYARFYFIGFLNTRFITSEEKDYLIKRADYSLVEKLCDLLVNLCTTNVNPNVEIINHLSEALASAIFEASSMKTTYFESGKSTFLTARILDYIEKNFRTKITIDSLASEFYCSKSLLTHGFKKDYGVSVMTYLKERRLKEIKFCLETTEQPINDIASEMGFPTMPYFYKYFNRKVGMTPQQYRLSCKKKSQLQCD